MLIVDIDRYIELHRTMGFKYRVQASLLRSFAAFSQVNGDRLIYTETVLRWAAQAPSAPQRRNRLLTVRRLAKVLHAEDDRHQIPPDDAFGHREDRRPTPHIFTSEELASLLRAAANLPPRGSLKPQTYSTLFALIAATGMRISEALALLVDDITDDGLIIRETKFRKSRLLPIHETTRCGLDLYLSVRCRLATPETAVFVSNQGTSLPYSTVNAVFLSLARLIGLRKGPGHRGPRLHDLRHTFAVRSLEKCAGNREAVARHLTALSTYLGHTHVSDTYWYLQATPTLMWNIAASSEAFYAGGHP
jgi:integrase